MTKNNQSAQDIITTASRLFQLYGYQGVGLNEIIKESGTSKGSFYYYFPGGKEELAIASIQYTKEMISNKILIATKGINDPVKAIQAYLHNMCVEYREGTILGVRIGTIAGETALINDPIRLACKAALDEWKTVFSEKFIAAGWSEEQSRNLSLTVHAMIEGAIILCLTEKSDLPLRIIADQIPFLLKKELNG
ncbi:TetR/AcrR family transcriptional regulator [Bacillus sp. FJAT-27251]|uniref:TetR/AcrR family transcriptional regulator n=1 Tax=Bacillus sp. FJAT-27251 TaxID=1684142 RepID=UPI0006A76218|nr:TetR/AcrR family transcriptional regulator [Bacillus sp. FJAT-27251]